VRDARCTGYLREAGAAIILQLLEAANTRKLATILQEAPALAEWLFCPLEVCVCACSFDCARAAVNSH
jgi:hypothetical protein